MVPSETHSQDADAPGARGVRTCAILVYEQRAVDTLISVDGEEELIVYLASVGKVWQLSAPAKLNQSFASPTGHRQTERTEGRGKA